MYMDHVLSIIVGTNFCFLRRKNTTAEQCLCQTAD